MERIKSEEGGWRFLPTRNGKKKRILKKKKEEKNPSRMEGRRLFTHLEKRCAEKEGKTGQVPELETFGKKDLEGTVFPLGGRETS